MKIHASSAPAKERIEFLPRQIGLSGQPRPLRDKHNHARRNEDGERPIIAHSHIKQPPHDPARAAIGGDDVARDRHQPCRRSSQASKCPVISSRSPSSAISATASARNETTIRSVAIGRGIPRARR